MARRKPTKRAPVRVPGGELLTERQRLVADVDTWKRGREAADRALCELVERARVDGMTWAEVGQLLGVTRQAAQQRFGRRSSAVS